MITGTLTQAAPNSTAFFEGPMKTPGSLTTVYVKGTWGGASVKIQGSPDGINFFDMKDAADAVVSLSADGYVQIYVNAMAFKLVASSAGATTDLDYWVL